MTNPLPRADDPTAGMVRARGPFLVGAGLLMFALFVLDLQTPIGLAVWLPYMGVILLTLGVPGRGPALAAAAGCSVLTMVGLFYPESPDPIGLSLINRSLAVVTFWLTAIGGLAVRRSAAL